MHLSQYFIVLFIVSLNRYTNCYVISEPTPCIPYVKKGRPSLWSTLSKPPPKALNPRDEIRFFLFTRRNVNCSQEIIIDNVRSLANSNFNPYWPTRIIIHGWMNNLYSRMNRLIKNAYLKKGNFNVIVVDWGKLAFDINYDRASKLVDHVGIVIAEMAIFLHDIMDASYNDMYVIGHSLGAQIAGVAGHYVPQKFNTIFALDPAEPNFKDPKECRIDLESAKYVESIQTDIGLLGARYPIGHASFFPNFGQGQPGCHGTLKACSHSRAYVYFAESINSDTGFWGIPCIDVEDIYKIRCSVKGRARLMGGEPSVRKNGIFYVPTNRRAFFARGREVHLIL